ncbi:MAG: BatD family protein, partial [Schleiferiaceae bacterium]|nr:BatD family protein [Schleiferiaceae bacterium]
TVDGEKYRIFELEDAVLIPQKAEEVKCKEVVVELVTGIPTGRRDVWGQPELRNIKHVLTKRVPTINVKPLPAGAPASFTGAVGQYNFEVSLSRNELEADESATLTIKISGSGNAKLVDLPTVSIPDDLETYDPKYSESFKMGGRGYKGYKKEEYLIIPRYKGEYKIPSITFSYFDLETEKYVTQRSEPLELVVLSGPENKSNTSISSTSKSSVQKNDIELLNEDILFIKTNDLKVEKEQQPFTSSKVYNMLLYIGIAGLILPWFVFGANSQLQKRGVFKKNTSAEKRIKQELALAKKANAAGDTTEMLHKLDLATLLLVQAVSGLNAASVEKELAKKELASKGIEQGLINELLKVWEQIEFARFAPLNAKDADDLIEQTQTITDKLLKA